MNIIITFGQGHAHHVNGKLFHPNNVAVIKCESHTEGREIAFEAFGPKWCFSHDEEVFDKEGRIKYFPEGKVPLNF